MSCFVADSDTHTTLLTLRSISMLVGSMEHTQVGLHCCLMPLVYNLRGCEGLVRKGIVAGTIWQQWLVCQVAHMSPPLQKAGN